MNQTQKKYTVDKIVGIYADKLKALATECHDNDARGITDKAYLAATSAKAIQKAIIDGEVPKVANPKGYTLNDLFNVSKYEKAVVDRLKIKWAKESTAVNSIPIALINRLTPNAHYRGHYTHYTRVINANKVLQAQLNVLCDEIMLGTSAEAKAAIAKAHAVKL